MQRVLNYVCMCSWSADLTGPELGSKHLREHQTGPAEPVLPEKLKQASLSLSAEVLRTFL